MKKIILSLIALMAAVSTNAQVVEVYENGELHATYYNTPQKNYKVVFKDSDDGTKINGHEYVKIAGRKWATMNVGATTVADSWETSYGDFYAWGETTTYYKSVEKNKVTMGKNASDAHITSILPRGIIDGGIYWIPDGTTLDRVQYNVAGVLFVATADTNKRVFFPAAGNIQGKARYSADSHVIYWTSELNTDVNTDASYANTLSVASDHINARHDKLYRYCGLSVRPVSD